MNQLSLSLSFKNENIGIEFMLQRKHVLLLGPVLGLSQAFPEAVLLIPHLNDLLLLRGEVDGLGHSLHHGVCHNS